MHIYTYVRKINRDYWNIDFTNADTFPFPYTYYARPGKSIWTTLRFFFAYLRHRKIPHGIITVSIPASKQDESHSEFRRGTFASVQRGEYRSGEYYRTSQPPALPGVPKWKYTVGQRLFQGSDDSLLTQGFDRKFAAWGKTLSFTLKNYFNL